MEISKFDQAAMAQIRKHEGVRDRPYKDTLGNWTVGIGHYIGKELPEAMNRRFTRKEIDQLFVEDYFSHKKDAEKVPGYERLDDKGRTVLIDLMYNIGLTTFNKFKKMKAAIAAGDTQTAAAEMKDSRWYTQTGNRSRALVAMMQEASVLPEPEPVLPEETAPPEPREPRALPNQPPATGERPGYTADRPATRVVTPEQYATEIQRLSVDIQRPELPAEDQVVKEEPVEKKPEPRVSVRELRRTPDRPATPEAAPEVPRDTPETEVPPLATDQAAPPMAEDISIQQPEVMGEVVPDTPEPAPEPTGRVGIQELRRTPDRPTAPGERPAAPVDRPVTDTVILRQEIPDPLMMTEEDISVDPIALPEKLAPTDTVVNNLAALGTMGELSSGNDTGVYGSYQQAKVMAEMEPEAVKEQNANYLREFNQQTVEAAVTQADPEIVVDMLQENAKEESSYLAPYIGASVKAFPSAPRSFHEQMGARYFAMDLMSEYMEGYSGWSVAGDILKSMIPGFALTDIIQSGVTPDMVETVKTLSPEDQGKFYAALLPKLNEAYDGDKTFVAQVFQSFLDPTGSSDLAAYQSLEKIFAGLDALTLFGGAAKLIRGGQVLRDAKKLNEVAASKIAAAAIKDQTGDVARTLNMTKDEAVQAASPFGNDTIEALEHVPNVPGALEELAPVKWDEIRNLRQQGMAVLSDELVAQPQLMREGEISNAIDRITRETEKKVNEAMEGTAYKVGDIRVTKVQGEDRFRVAVDTITYPRLNRSPISEAEFEQIVRFMDIPASQKKKLHRNLDETDMSPQEVLEDFVGNKKVVQQGIMDFRMSRTTQKGTLKTEIFDAAPALDDYGTYELRQKPMFDYVLSPVEKLDRQVVADAELLSSTKEVMAARLGLIYKQALAPVSGLRNRAARKNVENAYELWERATKVEYDAAGNVIGANNTRPTPYQLAYEGITGADGKKIYLKSQAERQAFYNIAEMADLFYLIGNKIDLQRLRNAGAKQIAINEGLRGFPRTTSGEMAATLRNLDENAMVFDVTKNKAIPKSRVTEELIESDNVLVSMYDAFKTDKGMFSVAIVPRNAISELGPYQRAKRNLYSPKINLGVRGVVFEVKDGVFNGVAKAATDPNNPNRKAIRFARGVKEGEKIAEELNQQAPDGVRYIFQEDSVDAISGELKNFQQTGLYRGARSKDEITMGLAEDAVETVPVYEALARNLQHLSNQYPINQWRMGSQQRFIQTVNQSAKNDAQKITSFGDTILDSHPKKAELEELRDYFNQQFKVPTKQEEIFEKKMLQLADWIEGKGLSQLSQTVMRYKDTNLSAKLRGVTFHSMLGVFNPAQLWVQAQNASIAASMHPWFAVKGIPRALALRVGLHADDEVLGVIAKRSGLDAEDFIATTKAFRKTGLHLSVRNNADFDAAIQGYGTTGRGFKEFLDKGLVFYRQGEISGRIFSWQIATQRVEQQLKKQAKAFTDADWREVFKQQQNITLNMSNANRAKFQEGLAAVPTQFFQVTTKFMEAVLLNGREITVAEKIRMLIGQAALYGAVGIPAGRWLVDTAAGYFDVKPEDVTEEQLIFMRDGIVGFLSGGELNLSQRSAINDGLERTILGFFEGEFNPAEVLLGATNSIVDRSTDLVTLFEPLLFNRSKEISTVDVVAMIGEGILDIPSSSRNLMQGIEMIRTQKYMDKNHQVIFTDPTWTEVAGKIAGFQPTREIIQHEVYQDQKKAQEYIDYRAEKIYNMYVKIMRNRGMTGENVNLDSVSKLLDAIAVQFDVDYEANPQQAAAIRKKVVSLMVNPKTKEQRMLYQEIKDRTGMQFLLNDATVQQIREGAQ